MKFIKEMSVTAKSLTTIAGLVSICVGAVIWMFSTFTLAEAFNQHIMDSKLEKLQAKKFELVKFVANCSRQAEEYGNLTVIETEACQSAEDEYKNTKDALCAGWGLSCPEDK